MKLPFVLPFAWLASILGMDYTPPAVIPAHMREAIEVKKDASSYQDMPTEHHKHKRHSSQQIVATVTDEKGTEVKLDIKQDGVLSGSTDTQDSSKSGHSTKFLALTNTATGLITALIGAGVTLAVKYGDKKC